MPQLDQLAFVYQSQWFWLALTLGTIFFVVGLWIVPKVESTIESRDARIAADLDEAQRLQSEAAADEEAWRARVNQARAEALAMNARAKGKAQADIDKRITRADKDIAARTAAATAELAGVRSAALAQMEAVASEAAMEIVAKLTGSSVSGADARKAVAGVQGNA